MESGSWQANYHDPPHADWNADEAYGGGAYAHGGHGDTTYADQDYEPEPVTSDMIKRVRQRFGPVDRRLAVTIAGHMNAQARGHAYVHAADDADEIEV